LRKERGLEKRERATEKERDSMREERRESLPKRELPVESERRARMRVTMVCLDCFTENLGVKQVDVKQCIFLSVFH
jgi:hypothetical protein